MGCHRGSHLSLLPLTEAWRSLTASGCSLQAVHFDLVLVRNSILCQYSRWTCYALDFVLAMQAVRLGCMETVMGLKVLVDLNSSVVVEPVEWVELPRRLTLGSG